MAGYQTAAKISTDICCVAPIGMSHLACIQQDSNQGWTTSQDLQKQFYVVFRSTKYSKSLESYTRLSTVENSESFQIKLCDMVLSVTYQI